MKRTKMIGLVAVLLVSVVSMAAQRTAHVEPRHREPRRIDLVICLDTSGSMSGLIESAKQKLWAVVNELATAKPTPALRVGLYHYGNNGLKKETGWVERLCGLTDDLGKVYGKLFPLRTNGGTEYVARVVRAATEELDWDMDKNTLRIIFVAGNEPATQDNQFKLADVCERAAAKGIIINTIFCGAEATGRNTGWADAARWADGRYAAIDQNRGTVVINTPYDKKLAELSTQLNSTYIPYGVGGKAGKANQTAQDGNAASVSGPASAIRGVAKASRLYNNASWDLVDAIKDKKVALEKIALEELPEGMRKMTLEKREAYVQQLTKRRAAIQKEIQQLNTMRDIHVKSEMARKGLSGEKGFDAALRRAVREQAQRKNFRFEKN